MTRARWHFGAKGFKGGMRLRLKVALALLVLSPLLSLAQGVSSDDQSVPPPPPLVPLTPAPAKDFPKPPASPQPPKSNLPAPLPKEKVAPSSGLSIGTFHVVSDRLRYDVKRGESIFSGHVYVRTDEYQIWADEVRVLGTEHQGQTVRAVARKGHWVYVQQHQAGQLAITKARSQKISYQDKSGTLWLQGDARVERFVCNRLVDTLSGAKIVYQARQNRYNVQGSKDEPSFTALSSEKTLKALQKQCQKP